MTSETVVVELTRGEAEVLLEWSHGNPDSPDCDRDVCPTCRARDKLQAALDSLEAEDA